MLNRDGLLWQYGMHHFHLRSEMGKDGFVKRSNHLLFAIVGPLDVYFVDVRRHPKKHDGIEWVRQELIRIVHSNWPNLIEANVLHGIHGAEWTDEDMHAPRQKNLNYTVDIDGKTIAPLLGGLAGDGLSVLCTALAGHLLGELQRHEEELRGEDVQRAVVRDRKAWRFDASLPLEFELVFRDELVLPPGLLDVLTAETCISRNLCQRGFVVVDKRTKSPIVIYAGADESAKRRARDLHIMSWPFHTVWVVCWTIRDVCGRLLDASHSLGMHAVVWTPTFLAQVKRFGLSQEEMDAIVNTLSDKGSALRTSSGTGLP